MPGHTFESKPWGDRRCLRCTRVLPPGFPIEWVTDHCPGNTRRLVDIESLHWDPWFGGGDYLEPVTIPHAIDAGGGLWFVTDYAPLEDLRGPTAAELVALEAEGDVDIYDEIITDVLDHEDTVSLDTLTDEDGFYEDTYFDD